MPVASLVAPSCPLPGLGTVAVLGLVLLLAGCGFAPRGAVKVPAGFGAIAVTAADPYSPLADGLRRSLERAGAPTVEAVASPDAPAAPCDGEACDHQ